MTSIFQGSPFDSNKLQQLLVEAQEAYHALQTGTKAVTIERQGRKITYNQTNIQDLRLYIQDLQATLSSSNGRSRRPARVSF